MLSLHHLYLFPYSRTSRSIVRRTGPLIRTRRECKKICHDQCERLRGDGGWQRHIQLRRETVEGPIQREGSQVNDVRKVYRCFDVHVYITGLSYLSLMQTGLIRGIAGREPLVPLCWTNGIWAATYPISRNHRTVVTIRHW